MTRDGGPSGGGEPAGGTTALRLVSISRTFPGTRALEQVSLDVRRGEIHALIGGNGSGKSTLIKVLAGVSAADRGGVVVIDGQPHAAESMSPRIARAAGIRFVHQQPTTFPDLTVAENLAVGRGFEKSAWGRIRWAALRKRAEHVLDRFGIDVRPGVPLEELNPAERTMVTIARALQDEDEARAILLLDEPTAALEASQVRVVLDALRRYAAAGQTILYVSHRLDEVLRIADRVSVLRDGRLVATVDADQTNESELADLIVGRAIGSVFPSTPAVRPGGAILQVRGLAGGAIRSATFDLQRGEVLGFAGLLGSGRSTLLQMIFGARPIEDGELRLDGRALPRWSPAEAVRAGIAYVPEDRAGQAAFPDMSICENLSQGSVKDYWRHLRLRHSSERTDARRLTDSFIGSASPVTASLDTLSGGNQQKVVLARWLRRHPRLLLLDDPTRGVDVQARAEILRLLREAVVGGASALLVSSDLEELARVSDRVIVLDGGRTVAQVDGPQISSDRLDELVYGSGAMAA